jgi:hypothetical protein
MGRNPAIQGTRNRSGRRVLAGLLERKGETPLEPYARPNDRQKRQVMWLNTFVFCCGIIGAMILVGFIELAVK